jgi:hypothetical protein
MRRRAAAEITAGIGKPPEALRRSQHEVGKSLKPVPTDVDEEELFAIRLTEI